MDARTSMKRKSTHQGSPSLAIGQNNQSSLQRIRAHPTVGRNRKHPLLSLLAISFDTSHNNQDSCLFIQRLPAEIRNQIYKYVLSADTEVSFAATPHITRGPISFSLLLSCRKVYLETHGLPLFLNAQTSILSPCYHKIYLPMRYETPFQRMVQWQKDAVREVQLFGWLCKPCFQHGVHLKVLLSRMGMSRFLESVRIAWYLDDEMLQGRPWCRRARRWAMVSGNGKTWDLGNFLALKKIIIRFSAAYRFSIDDPQEWAEFQEERMEDLEELTSFARSWRFRVGSGSILESDVSQDDKSWMQGHRLDFDIGQEWPTLLSKTFRWVSQEHIC